MSAFIRTLPHMLYKFICIVRSGGLREGKDLWEGCCFYSSHLLNLWGPQKQAWDEERTDYITCLSEKG